MLVLVYKQINYKHVHHHFLSCLPKMEFPGNSRNRQPIFNFVKDSEWVILYDFLNHKPFTSLKPKSLSLISENSNTIWFNLIRKFYIFFLCVKTFIAHYKLKSINQHFFIILTWLDFKKETTMYNCNLTPPPPYIHI